jgi:hypothetical protein
VVITQITRFSLYHSAITNVLTEVVVLDYSNRSVKTKARIEDVANFAKKVFFLTTQAIPLSTLVELILHFSLR